MPQPRQWLFSCGWVQEVFQTDAGEDAYRGANYARLAHLKARYDPDNLFRHNQNIEPDKQMIREGAIGLLDGEPKRRSSPAATSP